MKRHMQWGQWVDGNQERRLLDLRERYKGDVMVHGMKNMVSIC